MKGVLGVVWISAIVAAGSATAEERQIWLEDIAGARIEIAKLIVEPDGAYTLAMAEAPFTDHFLSMRPFKCLEGPDKHWCHVPYPYENRRNISSDLVDLEYDLLFLWKGATDYGIDTWNGVYYLLAKEGEEIIGRMHEIDLGELAVPPDPGELRPVDPDDLHEADPDSHWLPKLVIAPKAAP